MNTATETTFPLQWDHPANKDVFDALVRRLLELGESESTVVERAAYMVTGWEWFSDNSMDDRGHETCRDWMDPEVVRLLDQSLHVRYVPLD